MTRKPTYKELVQKIEALELEINVLKNIEIAETALRESEERYRSIIDRAHDGIVVVHNGRTKMVNPYLAELTGYTMEELENTEFTRFIPKEELPKVLDRYTRRMAGEDVSGVYESKIIRKDGAEIDVEFNTAVFTFEGEPSSLTFIRDISKRKLSEKAFLESEEKFKMLFENANDLVAFIGTDGVVLDINRKLEDIFGFMPEEVIGKHFSSVEWCSPQMFAEAMESFERVIHGKPTIITRLEAFRKDKTPVFIEASSKLIIKDGKEMGILNIIRDITEQKKMEAELKTYNEKLEEMVGLRTSALEDANTALRLMLKKEEEIKKDFGEKIVLNIKQLILPHLDIVKRITKDDRVDTYLRIMEDSLNDIVSPFVRKMSSEFYGLTPMEIQIADFIRHGKASKEIAELLGVSLATITTHRNNIRKKLKLRNKKVNLRTHLQSIDM